METSEELGSTRVDTRKVKQIVYNLLSNAVKFTGEGGTVTLQASRVPRAEVGLPGGSWAASRTMPLVDSGFVDFLRISVTDTGIGISAAGLEQLFRPFSQIDTGLARKFEGTGLGLAMVKLLAELHGGTVAVESTVGHGSCFTVWLPIRSLAEDAAAPHRPAAMAHAIALDGPRTALVVEDDYKSADLIRVQLEAEGFTVLHAASAEAALVMAVQQPLALITTDIILPDMDGWEMLGRLKDVAALARIPVMVISVVADRYRGIEAGAAAVLQKPISRQDLYESLSELGFVGHPADRPLVVLVVDDDPQAVELIAVHLQAVVPPATVLRAYGGRDAIEIARKERPDLIVLDLLMPEIDGFDVVEALSKHPETAGLRILVVTGKQISPADRALLMGNVTVVLEKGAFDHARFRSELRRTVALSPGGA
jgi:CheY-like chemotaxis protein/anti-sigma regulatory factor (Ser/Thr protein kinase)